MHSLWGPVLPIWGAVRPMRSPLHSIWCPVNPIWGVHPIWGSVYSICFVTFMFIAYFYNYVKILACEICDNLFHCSSRDCRFKYTFNYDNMLVSFSDSPTYLLQSV